MSHHRMSTCPRSPAVVPALRRSCPTRLRGLKNSSTTVAANLVEDCFRTCHTGSSVAELLAGMCAAFQQATANLQTYMLRLIILIGTPLLLPPLCGLFFSRTATRSAFVPAAVQLRFADTKALWMLEISLVTHRLACNLSASAGDVNVLETRGAITDVAFVLTEVAAGQSFIAGLVAVWDRVFA